MYKVFKYLCTKQEIHIQNTKMHNSEEMSSDVYAVGIFQLDKLGIQRCRWSQQVFVL